MSMERPVGRRCALGCETWPDEIIYRRCLECGEETTRTRGAQPMSTEEAERRMLYFLFEEYYERYCRVNGIPVEGPLPEKPGRPIEDVADALNYE